MLDRFGYRLMGWLAVASLALVVMVPRAKADSIEAQWTLDNVSFQNGAIATGFFIVTYTKNCTDCDFSATLTNFDVTVTDGSTTTGTNFNPTNTGTFSITGPLNGCADADNDGDCDGPEDPLFDLLQGDPNELQLGTATLEPPFGGVNNPTDVPLTSGFYATNVQTPNDPQTNLKTGGLDGQIVPEPASVVLMLTGGLGLLGLAWRKRGLAAQL